MSESKPRDENMIAALKRERATYVSRGDDDRVSQVDEQLKHYGYEAPAEPETTEPEGGEGPKGRTASKPGRQQTTTATGKTAS